MQRDIQVSEKRAILMLAPVKAAKPPAYFIVSFECGEKSTGTRSEPKVNKLSLSFAANAFSTAVEILEDESCIFAFSYLNTLPNPVRPSLAKMRSFDQSATFFTMVQKNPLKQLAIYRSGTC
jgi:hypothetical protein